jgi:DNA-binding NtrC family response regulator
MPGVLEKTSEEGEVKLWPIGDGQTTVGRSPASGVTLDHPSVSRDHALIQHKQGRFLVQDRDSRNGTRVNGVFCARHLLQDGDRIAFGDVESVFHETDELPPPCTKHRESATPRAPDALAKGAATVPLPLAEGLESCDLRVLNAWQTIRLFSNFCADGLRPALQAVLDNLLGIRDVRRAVLYVAPLRRGERATWSRAGEPHARSGAPISEDEMLEIAQKGNALGLRGGHRVAELRAQRLDALCLPISRQGQPVGCILVEGENELTPECVQVIDSTAEALSLGLSLSDAQTGRAQEPRRGDDLDSPIVGRSKPLRSLIAMAGKAAKSDSTVLLRGETGTGKELFACLIYEESMRADRAFVPVHCSAIEETLLGSALFGHEKGAFTGAVGMKRGLFEEADGGTLFLDEVGELSHSMQLKLLRVLQEGEFLRLGGSKAIHVDVRIVAATNRDLEDAISQGRFRRDLYFRLKVIEIPLPPLRERKDDIPDLAQHFVHELRSKTDTHVAGIAEGAMDVLQRYSWPGNIRELRNTMERCLVLAQGDQIEIDDLPAEILFASEHPECGAKQGLSVNGDASALRDVERDHILQTLRDCGGNKKLAAAKLGISRSTLYEKLKVLREERTVRDSDTESEKPTSART